MKIYVALEALPWESFTVEAVDAEGVQSIVTAHSTDTLAGYLPVFWSEEAAKTVFPNAQIQEVEIADDWHPRSAAQEKSAE